MVLHSVSRLLSYGVLILTLSLLTTLSESASQAFRRDPGHPKWHHEAFQDIRDSVRSDVRHMLHTHTEVPFQVPLEVNVVLVGFNGNGGYRYSLDAHKLEEFMRTSFSTHRLTCLETGESLDIEHHVVFNLFPAGHPELIELEKALKEAMVPAGTTWESEFGREVPLFEVEATVMELIFRKLYHSVRMDPRNKEVDLDSLMYGRISHLSEEDMKKQEGDYIY
ncbi:hypothetical protein K2173_016849 [Erythroxylum novogranatense]|uniref:DUF7906 domain-containing protein n=1 Tax=Erythroxylum novogranatense TaxID=1862640 RepID=A0AAV8SHC4_9ROSI|nr:hypothetical protein K2173_016849 [Erythroxylum novogranatense]